MTIPLHRLSSEDEGCYKSQFVLPKIECAWAGGRTQKRNVERMQARAIYALAASVVHDENPTHLERAILGDLYAPHDRLRLFERLKKGEYRVVKNLQRGERRLHVALDKLVESGGDVFSILVWELWPMLDEGETPLWRRAAETPFIEFVCSYEVPDPPEGDMSDAARYVSELFPPRIDSLGHLTMGIHCLKLAEASGNLTQYVLTYEGLFNRFFLENFNCFEAVIWWEVLAHLNRWFRVLELITQDYPDRNKQLFYKCSQLERFGIYVRAQEQLGPVKIFRSYPTTSATRNLFPTIRLPPTTNLVRDMSPGESLGTARRLCRSNAVSNVCVDPSAQ